jgi:hypothetical protein
MKIGFLSILFIGIAISIAVLSWAFFQKYQPTEENAQNQEAFAQQLQTEASKMPASLKRRKQAIEMVNETVKKWQEVVATRTPPTSLASGGISMAVTAWQMAIDVRLYRNSIQRALNRQLKAGGVLVLNGPAIPFPSDNPSDVVANFFNYPAIPFPVVIFDLGQVTVQGTYEQIKANMKAWTHMPNYLAVADGLTLNGTAPILTGTYNLSMVGYIRGKVIYPTLKQAGPAPAPAAGGGGGGGGGRRGGKFGGGG